MEANSLKTCRTARQLPKTGAGIPRRGGQRVQGPAGPGRVQRQSLWSHPRGTLGRCLKGSEINIQCHKNWFPWVKGGVS